MDLRYPKHLHSPKDNGEFVVVENEHEEAEQRKAGWLTAPPSQTKGQEAYAKAEQEAAQAASEPLYEDPEADAMPTPKKHKGKKKAE